MAVYMVRQGVTGPMKIGYSFGIAKRVTVLQSDVAVQIKIVRLFEGGLAEERVLHGRFKHLALGGEWFRFDQEMMGDLGLPELPIPKVGKQGQYNWPDSPWQYRNALFQEIFALVGGKIELARRIGVSPCDVDTYKSMWWSAALVLLRESGKTDITYEMIETADQVVRDDFDRSEAKKEAATRREWAIAEEARWIKAHPGIAPWWNVADKNKAPLNQPTLEIVAKVEAA